MYIRREDEKCCFSQLYSYRRTHDHQFATLSAHRRTPFKKDFPDDKLARPSFLEEHKGRFIFARFTRISPGRRDDKQGSPPQHSSSESRDVLNARLRERNPSDGLPF